MKAIVYEKYGSPDVLEIRDIEKPVPTEDEILVKVQAVSMNPLDWHRMRGAPSFARISIGLRKPKEKVLGADIAGRVEAIGAGVTQFKPGDEVYGEIATGGFAEYACAPQGKLAHVPSTLSIEEAASVPVAAVTALQGLRDHGHIKPGQRVLINGASGGVGSFAVQIAKAFGGEVTGVCSTKNLEMVRSIGADHVIDYTNEDFTANGGQYDLILDAVGNRTVSDNVRALRPNGICVVVGFTSMRLMLQTQLRGRWVRSDNKKMVMFTAQSNQEDLLALNELFESGKVKPVIDKRYSFGELSKALGYVEEGHARGKVVVTVP